jgi:hypothetical protein
VHHSQFRAAALITLLVACSPPKQTASPSPTVTSKPPDSYLTDALAHVIHPRGVAGKRAHPRPADACAPGRRHQPA